MLTETTRRVLRKLRHDDRGAMLIEMAIIAPVLITLALGSYDAGRLVTRQLELQGGVAEAESMVLAASASATGANSAELASKLETELQSALSLPDSGVQVDVLYRCNGGALVESADSCSEDDVISYYLQIALQDEYAPMWTSFGVSKTFDYNVVRTVQLGTVELPEPEEAV